MAFSFPGIGIVFSIDAFKSGNYGFEASEFLMSKVDPEKLGICIFVEGDTNATLMGQANEYCIGMYGSQQMIIYIRNIFEDLDDACLAPFHRRFIEKVALDNQSLIIRGQLDNCQRLRTDRWSGRDHKLCKEAGWGYFPEQVPQDLDANLYEELEKMKRPIR